MADLLQSRRDFAPGACSASPSSQRFRQTRPATATTARGLVAAWLRLEDRQPHKPAPRFASATCWHRCEQRVFSTLDRPENCFSIRSSSFQFDPFSWRTSKGFLFVAFVIEIVVVVGEELGLDLAARCVLRAGFFFAWHGQHIDRGVPAPCGSRSWSGSRPRGRSS